jgi:pimeloyl-ACP methyl ester carboxylesterase
MPRVFLLHGLGADRRAFQRFERLLPADWDIESLDLLGHGSAPHPDHGYSLDAHAAYIAEVIRQCGVTPAAPCVLVGHSYGAATAVAVAATEPALVSGIVLLDPVVRLDTQGHGDDSLTAAMIRARRNGTLDETVNTGYPDASDALRKWTVSTWQAMALGVVDEIDPDWMRFADRVTCRVTIIHGDLDVGGAGDLAADYFDEPVITRIAGAGHYLHATHARETAGAVASAVASP